MKRHEKPMSLCRSRSRLRIDACTETSSAETGSSATSSSADTRERPREADALALAARELVRVAVAELGAQADLVEELAHARVERRGRARGRAARSGSPTICAARHPRVERRVRVLEDHVQLAPQRPQLAPREVRDVVALAAGSCPAVGSSSRRMQFADGRLAAARLADEPEHLARRDRERDAVDGVHRAAAADAAAARRGSA